MNKAKTKNKREKYLTHTQGKSYTRQSYKKREKKKRTAYEINRRKKRNAKARIRIRILRFDSISRLLIYSKAD